MKESWKIAVWAGIVLDVLLTLKFTWLRENISALLAQLAAVHVSGIWAYLESYQCNLLPFRTIWYFLFQSDSIWNSVVNLGGNVVAFMPLGFLLPLVNAGNSRKPGSKQEGQVKGEAGACLVTPRSLGWKMTFISFTFSLIIEIGQLLMEIGSFDVDDLILNTLGGFLGYVMIVCVDWALNRRVINIREQTA